MHPDRITSQPMVEEMLAAGKAKRTVKQHLATVRKRFDWLNIEDYYHQ